MIQMIISFGDLHGEIQYNAVKKYIIRWAKKGFVKLLTNGIKTSN